MNQTPKGKLEKICFAVIEWGTYLALFSPLIFIKDYFFPFVVPKTIFFRITVDVIFIAYILLVFSNLKYRPKITPLTIAISLFIGILIFTSITGVNFARSFFSVFERMTGLLTILYLFVFYTVLSSVFKERKYWERILSFSVLAAVLISIYALITPDITNRGGGTLGNSSFFSSYLLFNIFFAIILLIWKKEMLWKIAFGLALPLLLSLLFFNPRGFTKGAVAAFVIGMIILVFGSVIAYLLSLKEKKYRNIAFLIIILLVLITAGIFQLNFIQEKIAKLWQSNSIQSRLIIWEMSFEGWQERFWLGWGWENFNIPFIKHYDPELPITGNVWYDRVHNIILDTGVSSGIIGLLSYLSIFGVAIFSLSKSLKLYFIQNNKLTTLLSGILITLLIVYFLQNVWVFDMISSYIMFFLTLAFISFWLYLPENQKVSDQKVFSEESAKIAPWISFVGASLIVLTIFSFFFANIQSARASRFILKGIALPLDQSLINFQNAFKTSPMVRFEGPEQFSMRISSLALQASQNPELLTSQNKELLNQGFQLAEEEFKKSIAKNILDFRLYLFLGSHYNVYAQFSGDPEKLSLAEQALEKALELGPNNQQIYYFFAQTRFLQTKIDEALNLLQKAKVLEPRFTVSRWYLVRGYNLAGKYDLALAELKELEDMGVDWKADPTTLKEAIEVLRGNSEPLETLIPLYEKGIELDENDLSLWENLVNAYIGTGQPDKAKDAAERLIKIKPELAPQVEQLMKDLGY